MKGLEKQASSGSQGLYGWSYHALRGFWVVYNLICALIDRRITRILCTLTKE